MRDMCHFGLREGIVGNSQVDEKEQTFGKQILTGPPGTMGHYGKCSEQFCLGPPRLPRLIPMC